MKRQPSESSLREDLVRVVAALLEVNDWCSVESLLDHKDGAEGLTAAVHASSFVRTHPSGVVIHVWVNATSHLQTKAETEVDVIAFATRRNVKAPYEFTKYIMQHLDELKFHSRKSGKVRNITEHNIYNLADMKAALQRYGDSGANRFSLVSEYEEAYLDVNTLIVAGLVASSDERLWRV